MNFFNGVKDITSKVARGMFALFTIKLAILLAVFVFQACTTDNANLTEESNSSEFQNSLGVAASSMNAVKLFPDKTEAARTNGDIESNGDLQPIHVTGHPTQDLPNPEYFSSLENFQDLVDYTEENNLNMSPGLPQEEALVGTFTVSEQDVKHQLAPSIEEAKSYLRDNRELTDADIAEVLNGRDESLLIPIVMELNYSTDANSTASLNENIISAFVPTAQAQSDDFDTEKAWDCAKAALGLNLFETGIEALAGKGLKKALKTAVTKIASRFLGPIGVALVVAEWAICYNGWAF